MGRYVLRRSASSVLMLLIISVLIFGVLRLLPGDPTISKLAGAQGIDPRAVAQLRTTLGLDGPLYLQYWHWISGAVHGDFGKSYFSSYPVADLIAQRVVPTVELAVLGLFFAVVIALVFSVGPLLVRGRVFSRLVGAYTTFGLSAPPFVVGILLILPFSVWLGWLPVRGYVSFADDPLQNLRLVLLPAITLGIAVSAPLIRYLRSSLQEVESSDFIRTAVGKGVPRRVVVLRHVLPNALLPALTFLGLSVGSLLGGVVVVEYVFSWPGLGSTIVDAVFKRDYAVIQSTVLLAASAYVVTTLVVDILYGVLDPRLRVAPRKEARRDPAPGDTDRGRSNVNAG